MEMGVVMGEEKEEKIERELEDCVFELCFNWEGIGVWLEMEGRVEKKIGALGEEGSLVVGWIFGDIFSL